MPKVVLGFVGKVAVGKGATVDYLVQKHGFYASSCSDRLREWLKDNDQEITREKLQGLAGEWRQKFGPAILAEKTWQKILENGAEKVIIDSIRGLEEVQFLKAHPGFHLIAVDASPKARFQRILVRQRESDPKTWEEFNQMEQRDLTGDGRNIEACIKLADFHINNEGTTAELYQELEKVLSSLNK